MNHQTDHGEIQEFWLTPTDQEDPDEALQILVHMCPECKEILKIEANTMRVSEETIQ